MKKKLHSSDQTRVSGDCESAQQKLHPDVSQRSLVGGEEKKKETSEVLFDAASCIKSSF